MRRASGCFLATVVLLLAACATGNTAAVHKSLAQTPGQPLPRRVLLLPVEVRVHEVSVGGVVEKVDEWTEAASARAAKVVKELSTSQRVFEIVESPRLTGEQRATLEQHVALYEVVAGSAYLARRSPLSAWRERAQDFDYTLGPGLSPLAHETGIDAAMVVIGSDYISSAGRRAAMLMGVVLGALGGGLVIPQGGISFVSVGVVDMRSGNLLWFGTEQSGATDLRNEQDVRRMLEGLFRTYPGLAPAPQPAAAS